jgi:Mn2+/Fe2+ NRAMP family transporter
LRIGPGALVAAAFIGPGTVTTATLAGAAFGYELLWALAFSTIATIALQEMAARLGVVGRSGVGEALRRRLGGAARVLAVALVIGALVAGNAAYETGNLLGAGLGLEGWVGRPSRLYAPAVGALAFGLLWIGRYRVLERALVWLVALMGLFFVATAVALRPEVGALARGLVRPSFPDGSGHLVLALVGTTVVPYNLFLHAAAASRRWSRAEDLAEARWDTALSVGLGGVISAAIVVAAAALPTGVELRSAAEMATALEPTLGRWAGAFFSLGLFAAGLSSAVTAPWAAAYATAGALGWGGDLRARGPRAVWGLVLGAGVAFALSGPAPVPAIVFAQAANGVLLPVIVAFLLWAVNDRTLLGRHANGWGANLVGGAVFAVAFALGVRSLVRAVLP